MKLNSITLSCILSLSSASLSHAAINYLDLTSVPVSNRTTPINGLLYFNPFASDFEDALSNDSSSSKLGFGSSSYFDDMTGSYDSAMIYYGAEYQWTGISAVDPHTVAQGTTIGSSTSFTAYGEEVNSGIAQTFMGSQTTWSGLDYGASGYFGFKITQSSETYYGWVNVTLNENSTVTYNEIAVNQTAGESILAGSAVPEPASCSLAAMGLALAALRRSRRPSTRAA